MLAAILLSKHILQTLSFINTNTKSTSLVGFFVCKCTKMQQIVSNCLQQSALLIK